MQPKILKRISTSLLLLVLGVTILGAGCEKEDTPCACGVENPQDNLEWLDHRLQKRFYPEIYSIQYQGKEYIGVYDRPKSPDSVWVIYDCLGEKFCEYIGFTGQWICDEAFKNTLKNKILIYVQETNPYWENKD